SSFTLRMRTGRLLRSLADHTKRWSAPRKRSRQLPDLARRQKLLPIVDAGDEVSTIAEADVAVSSAIPFSHMEPRFGCTIAVSAIRMRIAIVLILLLSSGILADDFKWALRPDSESKV